MIRQSPYPVQERAANVLARHLSVQECDVVHLEHAVVSVDEVGLVLAVDEHHVPGAVCLPGDLQECLVVTCTYRVGMVVVDWVT